MGETPQGDHTRALAFPDGANLASGHSFISNFLGFSAYEAVLGCRIVDG